MLLAQTILWLVVVYASIGGLVAVWFVMTQVGRVDAAAKTAPWSFRLIILPGAVALWPVVLGWARRAGAGGRRR